MINILIAIFIVLVGILAFSDYNNFSPPLKGVLQRFENLDVCLPV
jgi:hypothetical protein